jgi:hypothetical protein
MSSDILKNYPILTNYKNNNFFDTDFLAKINNKIINAKNSIVKINEIKENNRSIHKERIVNDYVIPLSYLIYSFIYTKYYSYQLKTAMNLENKYYYNMFGYIFKHSNPVIKKVNVTLYNYFINEKVPDDNDIITLGNIISLYISNDPNDPKNRLLDFLDDPIISKMKSSDDYKNYEKYSIIYDYFKKIQEDLNKMKPIMETIIQKINPSNSANKYDNENFITFFDYYSIKKQSTKFDSYETEYYQLLDIYKSIIKKIENINIQIIELNDATDLIYYDNLSINNLTKYIADYKTKYDNANTKKKAIDDDIDTIKSIKLSINQKIEIYEELFNNNNNNKKIKTKIYLDEIENISKKIKTDIDKIKGTPSNVNNFNNLLEKIIKSVEIYEEIETYYIKILFSKDNPSPIDIKEKLKTIQKYKIEFNNLLKNYKRTTTENKNLEKKEKETKTKIDNINILIKSYERNVNSSTINSNIKQLEASIVTKSNELKNASNDLIDIQNKLNNIINIKNKLDLKNFVSEKTINDEKTKLNAEITKLNTKKNEYESEIKKTLDLRTKSFYSDEITKLERQKQPYEDKIKKLDSILKIIAKTGTALSNRNIDEINSLNRSYKINGTKNDNYNSIEQDYFKNNSSISSDFKSKSIYKRIFIIYNYYNQAKNNKERDKTKLENELKNLKENKNNKKIKKYTLDIYNEIKNNLGYIVSLLSEKIKNKVLINSSDNKDLKDKFNKIFNDIINNIKNYELAINNKRYKKVNNKILNYYNKNYSFNKIIGVIKGSEKFNNNNGTPDKLNKKIINKLTDFFSDDDLFIQNLNNIFSNEFKDENVRLFFEQYKEFYNILKNKKIELLLSKISNKVIKYNDNNKKNIDFKNRINPKLIYSEKILASAEPSKNDFKEKKGKYIQVLPYTDVMFLYFIDLLIVIDYLTFYYY